MKQIAPLFKPLLEAFYLKQMTENRFNGDETRWEVFVEMEGKVGHRWYLWITKSPLVVYYRTEPSRGACVSKEHFGKLVASDKKVILVCDRYSSYKSLALENKRIKLAFCWAHVRRDFLDTARSWLVLNEWAFSWVEDIREVYRLNKQRLEVWDQTNSLKRQSPEFNKRQTALCDKLAEMEEKRVRELKEEDLRRRKKKVLTSLANHWQGLTVFVDHPEVPMDNNAAERNLRNEVVGRKNYYGSGSLWSAELAATMFTLLQTVILWKINPRHWLQAFLKACADNGGRTPEDLSSFLPWEMGEERRKELMQVPPFEGSQLLRLHADGKGESNEPECKDTS